MSIMTTTSKMNSLTNISMKTNYKKALEYYGLSTNDIGGIAKKAGVSGKKLKRGNIIYNKEQVYNNLIKKWEDDTTNVLGTYNFKFKRYNKETKKYQKDMFKFTVLGEKGEQAILAEKEFNRRAKKYQEEYDEWKDFDYSLSGDFIDVKKGEGNKADNEKTISTTKGGQRKVGMKGNKAILKMKDAFSLKFAGDEEQVWDRNQGTCVFDYLYWFYKNEKGVTKDLTGTKCHPKSIEDAYKFLNEILRIEENENPLVEGVSTYQLENFCDYYNINMYAYDETDKLIQSYQPKKSNKTTMKPLIFKVYDGHFHPIPKELRLSASSRVNEKVKTIDIETFEDKKEVEKKKYELIAPTQEEYDSIKEELEKQNYPMSVRNKVALDYIKKNGMKIPFPLTEKNLVVDENSIIRLRYDDKIVITEPINLRLKKWYEDNGEEYNGETSICILNKLWKKKYGFTISDAPFLSKSNNEVRNILSASKIKWRTHLGLTEAGQQYTQDKIIEMIRNGEALAIDICKCYCDALYSPRERWIVFNGKEQLEPYDKKPLTLGLYFVVTKDMTLFHQSNWYSKQMIMKARQEGIYHRITHQIRCVDDVWEREKFDASDNSLWKLNNNDLFGNIIDEMVELTQQDEDFTLTKLLINSISGYLGKTHYKTRTASINTKLDDIWENWIVGDDDKVVENNENIYISELKDNDLSNATSGKPIYLYGVEKKVENLTTGLPMYIQILDSANIALYDMIKSVGGTCIYRKTDCIVSIGGKIPQDKMVKYPCSYQETWGKYRVVDDAENYNYTVEMNIGRSVETPVLSQDWTHYEYNNSNDWKFIIEKAIEKGGILVSGRAGTGKSYIIEQGIKAGLLPESPESRMAFTNKAARNIGGTTIHKNLAINVNNKTNQKTLQGLSKYKIFVIDEISMIYGELWNKLCLLKKVTGAIFILLGDFRQCPPIEDGKEIDYFNHPYAKELANYNICELTTPQRYDIPLWNWLENFYEEGIVDYDLINKKKLEINDILYRRNIVYYNNTRETINHLCMIEMIKKVDDYIVLSIPDKCKNPRAQLTFIYKDLPVMVIVNNKDLGIINSDEMVVKDFNDKTITLIGEFLEKDLVIECKDFHSLFVVNYAATTHKSQGMTVINEINIFDFDMLQKDRRIGYTAVSRAKKPDQVCIVDNYRDFRTMYNGGGDDDDDEYMDFDGYDDFVEYGNN